MIEKHMTKFGVGLVILLVLYFAYNIFFVGPARQQSVGEKAPVFTAIELDNSKLRIGDLIGKKIIFINFWATWCPPCRDEIPVLNQINRELEGERFLMLGIMEDMQSHEELLKLYDKFTKQMPIKYKVAFDLDGTIAEMYGTYMLPESYILDFEGKILYKHVGSITKHDKKYIISIIKRLIP